MGKLAGQKDAKILSGTKADDLPIEDAFHKTLRTTTGNGRQCNQRLWEIGDIVDVLEAWEANNAKKIVS